MERGRSASWHSTAWNSEPSHDSSGESWRAPVEPSSEVFLRTNPNEYEVRGVFRSQCGYSLKTTGGLLTRFPLRSTITSMWSTILMNGIPLFIPCSLRSKAIVPVIEPDPVPLPVTITAAFQEQQGMRRGNGVGPLLRALFVNTLQVSCRNLVCRFGIQVGLEAFQGPLIKTDQPTAWSI